MYRSEDKYILPSNTMYQLEHRIQCIMPRDTAGEGGYCVSSLYFDDSDDSMLKDSLNGNPNRDKYRIRIYNNSFNTIKLEVKRKKYNKAVKLSSIITWDELQDLVNGDCIECKESLSDSRTLFNLAIQNKRLKPRVIVTYDRDAYIYSAGNVRVTFDRNIRASRDFDSWLEGQDIYWDHIEGPGSVLEVKYDEFIPVFIKQTLECNSMIQTSNSKYGLCRELYSGKVRR